MDDLICDLGECDHSPLSPPRAGLHGEAVFASKWKEWMAKYDSILEDVESNYMLRSVLRRGSPQITQRVASVAATFVVWLGTNCGRGFLAQAEQRELNSLHGEGYIAEWAIENRRHSWLNSGYRAIEHILGTDDCRRNGSLYIQPDLSADDYEVVEDVVFWLSTDDGKKFVAECVKEISERYLAENIASAVERRDFSAAKRFLSQVSA